MKQLDIRSFRSPMFQQIKKNTLSQLHGDMNGNTTLNCDAHFTGILRYIILKMEMFSLKSKKNVDVTLPLYVI